VPFTFASQGTQNSVSGGQTHVFIATVTLSVPARVLSGCEPESNSTLSADQNERDLARLISSIHPRVIRASLHHDVPSLQVHL
jgi:hypothetical protein